MRRLFFACLCASLVSVTAAAQMTTVIFPAHVGAVDESSTPIVNFGSSGAAGLRATVPAISEALIRYLVPNTVVPGATAPCIDIAFRDTGADAQVRVLVRELDFLGANRIIGGTFNSDLLDAAASPDFRMATHCFIPRSGGGAFFDFTEHAYVIEVSLRRNLAGGQPGVQLMQITTP